MRPRSGHGGAVHGARRERGRAVKGALTAIGLVLALAVTAMAAAYLTFPHAAVFHRLPVAVPGGLVAAGALGAMIAAVAAWRAARRLLHGSKSANVLTVLAATVATIVSATGMWAFFAAYVPTIPVLVRIPIFAFLELSTVAEALRARDNMREFGSSGIDGLAMWVLTGTSAFLASLASSSVAEALFRLAPPLVAAWLWERALVSERRRRADRGQREEITSRISPKRILVRLGLAEPAGQTLGETAAQRRIMVLALAAEAVAALEDAGAGPGDRRHQRAERRLRTALRQAVELADLAGSPARQTALVNQLRILRSPHDLVTLDAESPWAQLAGPPQEAAAAAAAAETARGPRRPARRPGTAPRIPAAVPSASWQARSSKPSASRTPQGCTSCSPTVMITRRWSAGWAATPGSAPSGSWRLPRCMRSRTR